MFKNTEKAVFSYKTLRLILMAFGSFLIVAGSMYAYFIAKTVGVSQLDQVKWTFLLATLMVPAGIIMCIVGKKLQEPIIKTDKEDRP